MKLGSWQEGGRLVSLKKLFYAPSTKFLVVFFVVRADYMIAEKTSLIANMHTIMQI